MRNAGHTESSPLLQIVWIRLGFPADDVQPNDTTARWAILYTGLLAIAQSACCLVIVFAGGPLSEGKAWAVILLIVLIIAVLVCFSGILRQPQNKYVNSLIRFLESESLTMTNLPLTESNGENSTDEGGVKLLKHLSTFSF